MSRKDQFIRADLQARKDLANTKQKRALCGITTNHKNKEPDNIRGELGYVCRDCGLRAPISSPAWRIR